MKIISKLTTLFSILVLTACSQNPISGPPEIDRLSKIRSITYTHRHLLEQQLGSQVGDINSGGVLMQSYCDLIRRGVVDSELPPQCEPGPNLEQQTCMARFHRCVGVCPIFLKDCPVCEFKAERCLEDAGKVDSGLRPNN